MRFFILLLLTILCRHHNKNSDPFSLVPLLRAAIITAATAPPQLRDTVVFINTLPEGFDSQAEAFKAFFPEEKTNGVYLNKYAVFKPNTTIRRARNATIINQHAHRFHRYRAHIINKQLGTQHIDSAAPFRITAIPTYLVAYKETKPTDPINSAHYAVLEPRIDTSLMDSRPLCDGGQPPATSYQTAEQLISALMIANTNDIHHENIVPKKDGSLVIIDVETVRYYGASKKSIACQDERFFLREVHNLYHHCHQQFLPRLMYYFDRDDRKEWEQLTPEQRTAMTAPQHPHDQQWFALKQRRDYFVTHHITPHRYKPLQAIQELNNTAILSLQQAQYFTYHYTHHSKSTPCQEEKQRLIDAFLIPTGGNKLLQ